MDAPFLYRTDQFLSALLGRNITHFTQYKYTVFLLIAFFGLITYYILPIDYVEEVHQLRFYNSSIQFNKKYYSALKELGVIGAYKLVNLSKPLPLATLITAVSEENAGEARDLIFRIYSTHPYYTIHVYDIGMSNKTKKWFKKECNVILREMNLIKYTANYFADYRWRPIVIATALKEFPVVFYMDTSTFLSKDFNIKQFIDKIHIKKRGPHVYLMGEEKFDTFTFSTEGMIDYLLPKGDIFKYQYNVKKQLWIRTRSTLQNALKWYVLCALEEKCMVPPDSKPNCIYPNRQSKKKTEFHCHKYDQSALNLILSHHSHTRLGPWTWNYLWNMEGYIADESPLNLSC